MQGYWVRGYIENIWRHVIPPAADTDSSRVAPTAFSYTWITINPNNYTTAISALAMNGAAGGITGTTGAIAGATAILYLIQSKEI